MEDSSVSFKNIRIVLHALLFGKGVNRLPRAYYWIMQIITWIMLCGTYLFGSFCAAFVKDGNNALGAICFLVAAAFLFASFVVNIQSEIARLHDSNHSGWYLLLFAIPYVGWIPGLAMLGFYGSNEGDNDYGAPLDCRRLGKRGSDEVEYEDMDMSVDTGTNANADTDADIKVDSDVTVQGGDNKEDYVGGDIDSYKKVEHTPVVIDDDEYWALVSFAYGKIKETSIFRLWRKEQFDCQFGKCAICGKPMELRFAQVDHTKPRYKRGTNYSDNLVLAHKDCNKRKGARSDYERPEWIKKNKFSEKYDDKVSEITESIRAEYPVKFPDELFVKPDSNSEKNEEQ